jgi:hypothetical protein
MAERIKSNFVPFKKGQMVWLDLRHLKTNYHKKMAPKQEGLFEIEEVLGPVTYQLKLLESWQIHKVFHATLLHPYQENEVCGENYIQPPSVTSTTSLINISIDTFSFRFYTLADTKVK